jgi:hypothetical protein
MVVDEFWLYDWIFYKEKQKKLTLLVTPQRSVLNDLTNVVKNILVRFSSWLVCKCKQRQKLDSESSDANST